MLKRQKRLINRQRNLILKPPRNPRVPQRLHHIIPLQRLKLRNPLQKVLRQRILTTQARKPRMRYPLPILFRAHLGLVHGMPVPIEQHKHDD